MLTFAFNLVYAGLLADNNELDCFNTSGVSKYECIDFWNVQKVKENVSCAIQKNKEGLLCHKGFAILSLFFALVPKVMKWLVPEPSASGLKSLLYIWNSVIFYLFRSKSQ